MKTQAEMDEIFRLHYEELAKQEKEIQEHNRQILLSIGVPAFPWFTQLVDGCKITDKIEVVPEPEGEKTDDTYGIFAEVYVDQDSGGPWGDSYSGDMYARFAENKWLKIPYSC